MFSAFENAAFEINDFSEKFVFDLVSVKKILCFSIFTAIPADSISGAHFKSGQKRL